MVKLLYYSEVFMTAVFLDCQVITILIHHYVKMVSSTHQAR